MVSAGAFVFISPEHSFESFLQQVAFFAFGVEAFSISRLAISIAAIKPTLIHFFVCMVVVLGGTKVEREMLQFSYYLFVGIYWLICGKAKGIFHSPHYICL